MRKQLRLNESVYSCEVNFINLPTRSFYWRRSQKHHKRQSSHQCLFAFLGSARAKAVHKTLVKLSPDPVPLNLIHSFLLTGKFVPLFCYAKCCSIEVFRLIGEVIYCISFYSQQNIVWSPLLQSNPFETSVLKKIQFQTSFSNYNMIGERS